MKAKLLSKVLGLFGKSSIKFTPPLSGGRVIKTRRHFKL